MTYLEILDLIDTNLASGSNIPAVKHREVEKEILGYSKYIGYITGFNVGNTGSFTVGGGLVSASSANGISTLCTMATAMPNTNYFVKIHVESLGVDTEDFAIFAPSFKKVSTTQFNLVLGEPDNYTQNLKIHFEIVSLD